MSIYLQLLEDLLNQQSVHSSDSDIFYTIYFPTNHKTKLEIKKNLKSIIYDDIKNNLKLSSYNDLNEKIYNQVAHNVDLMENINHGMGIFIHMNNGEIKDEDVTVINLGIITKQSSFIGEIYLLNQLIEALNNDFSTLVIHLERESSDIYVLEKQKLSHYKNLQNELMQFDLINRNKRLTPFSDREKYFGGGEYNMQRREEDENLNFFNQIIDFINEDSELHKNFKYLIVFYSSSFHSLADRFNAINFVKFGNPQIILCNRNLQIESDIEKEAKTLIKAEERKKHKNMIKDLNNEYKHFAKGWDEIIATTRENRIDTLFIKPSAFRTGVILDKEFAYKDLSELNFAKQITESRFMENILPWIVKKVIESSGKIILSKGVSLGKNVNIAAKLRY